MKSAATTHLSSRILLTVVMFAVIGLIYWTMRRGWKSQAQKQSDIPAPFSVGASEPRYSGTYASTTLANQPLTRVVVHGLGSRSSVEVGIGSDQIDIYRSGSTSFSIPLKSIIGVSRASGIAGKFMGDNSLTVITWKLGNREVDTGLLIAQPGFAEEVAS